MTFSYIEVCRSSESSHVIVIQYHVTVTSEWHHSDVTLASLFRHTRITRSWYRAVCQQNRNIQPRITSPWHHCMWELFLALSRLWAIEIQNWSRNYSVQWCESDVTMMSFWCYCHIILHHYHVIKITWPAYVNTRMSHGLSKIFIDVCYAVY